MEEFRYSFDRRLIGPHPVWTMGSNRKANSCGRPARRLVTIVTELLMMVVVVVVVVVVVLVLVVIVVVVVDAASVVISVP
jgi:hypothetical protein